MQLVVASANPDKAAEIATLLSGLGFEVVPRPTEVPDVEETGETLLDNARLKARAISQATGQAAVADDTGLEVDALDGAPGVYTARFAGDGASYDDNVAKMLEVLADRSDRTARFRSVALVCFPDGKEVWCEGVVEGIIARQRRGSNGFGYDPIFEPADGGGRTLAEFTPEEKHAISHRGRAFRALAAALRITSL